MYNNTCFASCPADTSSINDICYDNRIGQLRAGSVEYKPVGLTYYTFVIPDNINFPATVEITANGPTDYLN